MPSRVPFPAQAADAVQQQAAKAASAVEAGVESVQSKWDAQRKENAQRNAEMVARQKVRSDINGVHRQRGHTLATPGLPMFDVLLCASIRAECCTP